MRLILKIFLFIAFYCVWVMASLAIVFGVFTAGLPAGELPLPAIIVYLVVILIPIWVFAKWINAEPRWMKKVLAEGKQAPATILSVKNTGVVINNTEAIVKLQLRVEPSGEAPFEVSQDKEISMITGIGRYEAGAHLQVKYDPDNKKHLAILSGSAAAPSYSTSQRSASEDPELAALAQYETSSSEVHSAGSDVAHDLADLAKLHKNGDLSDAEFEAAKKKLLS